MTDKTIILGITGSIATGKSTYIQKLITEFATEYCDADKLVHTLYEPEKPAYHRILDVFGKDILDKKTQYIDRKKLGAIVFKDKHLLQEQDENEPILDENIPIEIGSELDIQNLLGKNIEGKIWYRGTRLLKMRRIEL